MNSQVAPVVVKILRQRNSGLCPWARWSRRWMGSEVADGRMSFCVPSKGALADGTVSLFRNCLIPLKRTRGERSYEARLAGMDDVDVQLVRPADVPYLVESGQALAGITGLDLVREHRGSGSSDVQEVLTDLDFGSADLVVGVPVSWLDVSSIDDLVDVAQEVRHKHRSGATGSGEQSFPILLGTIFESTVLWTLGWSNPLERQRVPPGLVRPTLVVGTWTSTGTTLKTNGSRADCWRQGAAVHRACLDRLRPGCRLGRGTPNHWVASAMRFEALRTITAHRERTVTARFAPPGPSAEVRATFAAKMVDYTWSELSDLQELVGRAEISQIPTLLSDLAAAGSLLVAVDDPSLVVTTTSAFGRFRAQLQHQPPRRR